MNADIADIADSADFIRISLASFIIIKYNNFKYK